MWIAYDVVPEISTIEGIKLCTGEITLDIFGRGFGFHEDGLIVTVTIPKYPNTTQKLEDSCTYPRTRCDSEMELKRDSYETIYCTDIQLTFHDELIHCVILDSISPGLPLEVTVTSLHHNPPQIATFITHVKYAL